MPNGATLYLTHTDIIKSWVCFKRDNWFGLQRRGRGGGRGAQKGRTDPPNKLHWQSLPLFCLDSRCLRATIKAWPTLLEPISTSATKSIHTWSAPSGRNAHVTHSPQLRSACAEMRALRCNPPVPSSRISIFHPLFVFKSILVQGILRSPCWEKTGFQRLVDSIPVLRNRLETQ